MLYVLQILTLLVAHYLGRHDAPACDQFSNFGSSVAQQRLFHGTNWKAKLVVLLLVLAALYGSLPTMGLVVVAISITFIMWPAFNISLNLARKIPKRSWDYISTGSNKTDVLLRKWFGSQAGKALLLISVLIVIAMNVLLYILYAKSYPHSFRLA